MRLNKKQMKKLIIILAFATAYSLFSCKGQNEKPLPEVLTTDTLATVYEYSVTDTFASGETRRIKFYDKTDTTTATYEKRYYKNGNICMEGPLDSNGLRDGRWTAWYDNGKVWSTGDYSHGLRNGENKVYYVNGQVQYNKKYVNDTAEGIWTFYLEDGTEALKLFYEKGKVIELVQYAEADSLRNLSR